MSAARTSTGVNLPIWLAVSAPPANGGRRFPTAAALRISFGPFGRRSNLSDGRKLKTERQLTVSPGDWRRRDGTSIPGQRQGQSVLSQCRVQELEVEPRRARVQPIGAQQEMKNGRPPWEERIGRLATLLVKHLSPRILGYK